MFEGYISIIYVTVIVAFSLVNLLAYLLCFPSLGTPSLTRLLVRFIRVVYVLVLLIIFLNWKRWCQPRQQKQDAFCCSTNHGCQADCRRSQRWTSPPKLVTIVDCRSWVRVTERLQLTPSQH